MINDFKEVVELLFSQANSGSWGLATLFIIFGLLFTSFLLYFLYRTSRDHSGADRAQTAIIENLISHHTRVLAQLSLSLQAHDSRAYDRHKIMLEEAEKTNRELTKSVGMIITELDDKYQEIKKLIDKKIEELMLYLEKELNLEHQIEKIGDEFAQILLEKIIEKQAARERERKIKENDGPTE